MITTPQFFRRLALFALTTGLSAVFTHAQEVGADAVVDVPKPPGITVRPDLAYDALPRQKLDLYLPVGRPAHPRPVIVYLHGGGWQKGSKADGRRLAFRFAAKGYAVACVNYRLSGEAGHPAQLEDCKSAVRWLRENADRFGLDPDHVGVIGVSAGGHLAALMGAMNSTRLYESGASMDQPSRVQAVCDFFGPVDLQLLFETSRKQGTPQADEVAQLLGGDPHYVKTATQSSNPILFADVESPPFLIIHGDEDKAVPLEQSQLLYDALVRKHVSVHLHIIHGAGHTGPAFIAPDINAIVDEFFAQTLAKGNNPPNLNPTALTESDAVKN
jgi:acetyl esterase/lipase